MADTPEVKAKNRIKKEIARILKERNLPAKIIWNAGNAMGVARLDCDGVVAGHPFAIEVKRFDKPGKVTARQVCDVNEYSKAGAFSMIVQDEDSLAVFLGWLRVIEPRAEWGGDE